MNSALHHMMTALIVTGLVSCQSSPPVPQLSQIKGVTPELYSRSFGDLTKQTFVFIHGGPGYNSYDFEFTTAQPLADRGYGVVVYDQLGSGRSPSGVTKDYSFTRASTDLKEIIAKYHLQDPILIGHSFGGMIGVEFLNRYPDLAKGMIAVGAPLSVPSVLKNIMNQCPSRYTSLIETAPESCPDRKLCYTKAIYRKFSTTLATEMAALKGFSTGDYSALTRDHVASLFEHGMGCGLYTPKHPTSESSAFQAKLFADENVALMTTKIADQTETGSPMYGFYTTEDYARRDFSEQYKQVAAKIRAMIGNEDGLFSPDDIQAYRIVLSEDAVRVVDGASHAVFINQQAIFLDQLIKFSEALD